MTTTTVASSAIPALPNAVLENIIFLNLSLPELAACSPVCKAWKEMAKKQINTFSHPHAFGPKEWYTYFGGHLRNVPRLPSNIAEIMNSPCPFWRDKKVHETHVLVFIPETVSGQPLNLKLMGELVQKPLQGYVTKYNFLNLGECVDKPAQSHWVLMTRDVIQRSRNKSCKEEPAVLAQYTRKTTIAYEIPTVLDATVCNFMEYVRTGTWLYGENPVTYTWCQEKSDAVWHLVVGGGSGSGLGVSLSSHTSEHYGVGGLRKL